MKKPLPSHDWIHQHIFANPIRKQKRKLMAQHHISTGRQWVRLRRKLGLTTPKMWRRASKQTKKNLLANSS